MIVSRHDIVSPPSSHASRRNEPTSARRLRAPVPDMSNTTSCSRFPMRSSTTQLVLSGKLRPPRPFTMKLSPTPTFRGRTRSVSSPSPLHSIMTSPSGNWALSEHVPSVLLGLHDSPINVNVATSMLSPKLQLVLDGG